MKNTGNPMAPALPPASPHQDKKRGPDGINRFLSVLAFVVGMAAVKYFSGTYTKWSLASETPSVFDVEKMLSGHSHVSRTMKIGQELIPCDVDITDHHGAVTFHFNDGMTRVIPVDIWLRDGKVVYRFHNPDGTTAEMEQSISSALKGEPPGTS